MVFCRLWEELGLAWLWGCLHEETRVEFDLPEAVFGMVLNRLMDPASRKSLVERVAAHRLGAPLCRPQAAPLLPDAHVRLSFCSPGRGLPVCRLHRPVQPGPGTCLLWRSLPRSRLWTTCDLVGGLRLVPTVGYSDGAGTGQAPEPPRFEGLAVRSRRLLLLAGYSGHLDSWGIVGFGFPYRVGDVRHPSGHPLDGFHRPHPLAAALTTGSSQRVLAKCRKGHQPHRPLEPVVAALPGGMAFLPAATAGGGGRTDGMDRVRPGVTDGLRRGIARSPGSTWPSAGA